jgi:hypothetical protein
MAVTPLELNDLVAATIRDLDEPNLVEIATDIQEFTAADRLLRKKQRTIQGGIGVQWDVMANHSGTFENVGIGAQDNPEIPDHLVQAQADWRGSVVHWSMVGQEMSMNAGKRRIVDLMMVREKMAMIDWVQGMEDNFWGPPVALTDDVTPWGVNTWLVKNATEGFNGAAPSGHTTIGLNPTTYPRWKNYTGNYAAVSKADLILKMRRAARKTNFKPPVAGIPGNAGANSYGFYTTESVISTMEDILEAQNESLGVDIDPMSNKVMFQRTPLEWVPYLDADTTNPVYGLNWKWIQTIVLAGWWMKRTAVPVYPGQHTMSVVFLDSVYQIVFKNRRAHFVLATGTTYPS